MTTAQDDVIISLVETEDDLKQANVCVSEAFGRQTKDAVWMLMNPGWDTDAGQAKNAQSLVKQWKSTTLNKDGLPNAIYLKATLPDPDNEGRRKVVGYAVWKQLSYVEGYGEPFTGDMTEAVKDLDEVDQRFATQMFASLWKRRLEYIRKVSAPDSGHNPPAIFTLDICAVHPGYQRRGIAGKLVDFGLAEAKRRGDLECTTEGSAMGRPVYMKRGFKHEGVGDVVWEVDEEFQGRDKPPNIFLRTRV